MFPSFNLAATEAAITGNGILFQERGSYGIIWWEGPQWFARFLYW